MATTNKDSVRQRIVRLEAGESAVFPIERANYVSSIAYRLAQTLKRKYTCPTTENQIKVIRIQ